MTDEEDEPVFILRASDRAAPLALHAYADAASMYGMPYEETTKIRQMAADLVRWRTKSEESNDEGRTAS